MTYRLKALRNWTLRITTYLLVSIAAVVAGCIPVGASLYAMVALQREMLTYGAVLWVLVVVFIIVGGLVLFKGMRLRKDWLWFRFWIDVGE